jgi:Uma2 family endonuclease
MEAARVLPMSVADYLALEEKSQVKHELIGGEIHAMSGASRAHNAIAGNIFAALRTGLRGGPCRVFIADVKVRLEVARDVIFYYPDVVVACHDEDGETHYTRKPTLVVEVLSPTTEATDRREKHANYRYAPTLEEYVLVAQDRREVTLYRRATDWQAEIFTAPDATIEFRSVKLSMLLAEIYESVL